MSHLVPARKLLVVAILVGALGIAFETYAVLTAMPHAAKLLGRLDLYAWTFTMFVTGQVLAIVIAGRIADSRGPITPLIAGFSIFTFALAAVGTVPSMHALLACRFAQGLGAGALSLGLMVLIAEAFTETERPTLMMAFSFAWVGPSFFGPPLAAWITTSFGWRWVFWAVVPLMVAAAALGIRPLRAMQVNFGRKTDAKTPVPLWAAFVVAIGVTVIQIAGQRLDPNKAESDVFQVNIPVVVGLAITGGFLLVAAVPKLMPPGVLTIRPGLPAVMWVRASQAGSFFVIESFLPLILVQQRSYSLEMAGFSLTVGAIGWTFGSWLQARPKLPLRRDQIIVVGAINAVIGAIIMVVSTAFPQITIVVALFGYIMSGIGMGFTITSTSLATMALSVSDELGRNTSSLQVSEGLGVALFVGAGGAVFASLRQWQSPQVTFSVMMIVAVLAAIFAVVCALRIGPVEATADN